MNWLKQQAANIAGTQEPVYGSSAIQSVAKQAETTPYTELQKSDLRWAAMKSTCVETQTFHLFAETEHIGIAQVIYSNVAGIRTACQFNTKVFYPDGKTPNLWSTDDLKNYGFDNEHLCFHADSCAVDLSEDGSFYSIKSTTNKASIVNLKVSKRSPGFQVGNDGKSYFGTDPDHPWGSMRHVFWPRCAVEGSITTKAGALDFKGHGILVHALQGMKPHHAVAKWNFVNFQGPTYSAVMMEYTTPPSYGSTIVNVGGLASDGEIICAGSSNSISHTEIKDDPENDWPEPAAVKFLWSGQTKTGQPVTAELSGGLGRRLDKVDVMAEVPRFVKNIVGNVAGTKPYIYQFSPQTPLKITVSINGSEHSEEGTLFSEAIFIS